MHILPIILLSLFHTFGPFQAHLREPQSPSYSHEYMPTEYVKTIPAILCNSDPYETLSTLRYLPISYRTNVSG